MSAWWRCFRRSREERLQGSVDTLKAQLAHVSGQLRDLHSIRNSELRTLAAAEAALEKISETTKGYPNGSREGEIARQFLGRP